MSTSTRGHSGFRKRWGGGLHRAPDLILITADAGSNPHTSQVSLETLCPTQFITEENADGTIHYSPPTDERAADIATHTNNYWLDHLPATEATRTRRDNDVSEDPRYGLQGQAASNYDAECTSAPNRIPACVLPEEDTQALFEAGKDTGPDLIYARGVLNIPDPGQTNFDKMT